MDSALQAGVQHIIYSTWGSCEKLTGGKLSSAHDRKYFSGSLDGALLFEHDIYNERLIGKHDIEQYIRSNENKLKSASFIGAGWYLEYFLDKDSAELFGGFPLMSDSDGYLTYRLPYYGGNGEVPFVDISHDFGDVVHGMLLDPERWNGRIIHAISEMVTQQDVCQIFESCEWLLFNVTYHSC